ncbi:MAG: class I SAM-dependent methyltransferase [Pyrinomonadaceae bacterium]
MVQKVEKLNNKTQTFYDRIADVHNLAMKVNGYRDSLAKYLRSLDLGIKPDSLVLDAGSGTGLVTKGFYKAGFAPKQTFALDLSFNSLKVSREQFLKDRVTKGANITAIQGNVLSLPFPDETFDLVLTCGVLEYVPLEEGLRELSRVMKKGGRLILIPVKPSFVGSVLKILYNFKLHPIKEVRKTAQKFFDIEGDYKFPITEPISWSKMIFLLQKK